MELKGDQYKKLQEALWSAFPNEIILRQMVRIGLNENLTAIAGSGPLTTVVFELIEWARAHDRIEELILAALNTNRGNKKLRDFANSVGLAESELSPIRSGDTNVYRVYEPEGVIRSELFPIRGGDTNEGRQWDTVEFAEPEPPPIPVLLPESQVLTGHSGDVSSVAVTRDGQYALSGSDDAELWQWDLASGREVWRYKGHGGE